MKTSRRALFWASGLATMTASSIAAAQEGSDLDAVTASTLDPIVIEALGLSGLTIDDAIEPASVLTDDALVRRQGATLGDTLSNVPGVSSSDFGIGVGRPVIRGLAGPRVRVQDNGLSSADVSTLSPDHAVTVDSAAARQIEVLRGPSTLLYGSGAIGGVVNVVTDRVPRRPVEGVTGQAELARDLGTTGLRMHRADVTAGHNGVNVNVHGLQRLTDDYEADDDRLIENSATDTDDYGAGLSYAGDWGHVGGSVNQFDTDYGIPGEEALIRLEQERYTLSGEWFSPVQGLERLSFSGAYTDYLHSEGEEVPEIFFDNEETEFRLEAEHVEWRGLNGVVGVQGSDRQYESFGEEEIFVPPVDTRSIALFAVEQLALGDLWTLQGGARVEHQTHDVDGDVPDRDHTPLSLSAGVLRELPRDLRLTASIGRYQRAPAAEELYSNGPHEATETFERGSTDFDEETAHSIEVGLARAVGRTRFDANLFYTRYDDYIYTSFVDRGLDADGGGMAMRDGQPDRVDEEGIFEPDGELLLLDFRADDARFFGGELAVAFDLIDPVANPAGRRVTATLQGDYVDAELTDGRNLERITPARYGAGLEYEDDRWLGSVELLRSESQSDTALLEEETGRFEELSAFVGYRIPAFDATQTLVYLRGENLLDEEIVRSTSFLRVPLPGRQLTTGVQVRF